MSATATSGVFGPVPAVAANDLTQFGGYTRLVPVTGSLPLTTQIQLNIVQSDTLPILAFYMQAADGSAVDLTNAATVYFLMLDLDGNSIVNSPATIVGSPTNGEVEYAWADGDTDQPGLYVATFQATFNDGTQLSAPQDQPIRITIRPLGA